MYNLPLEAKYLAGPVLVLVLCSLLHWFEPNSSVLFEYFRNLVSAGEIWRLLTSNFVHTNFMHLVLNGLGVIFIWVLHAEHYSTQRYLGLLCFCAVITGLGIHYFGTLHSYAGLSGALHGVIAYGAVKDIKGGLKFGWPLLLGIVIKVGYENTFGASDNIKALINASVAVDAHLYGLCAGLLAALPVFYRLLKEGVDDIDSNITTTLQFRRQRKLLRRRRQHRRLRQRRQQRRHIQRKTLRRRR